ncbi:hypothetical protein RJ640_026040, partial [Escallonia rubra]
MASRKSSMMLSLSGPSSLHDIDLHVTLLISFIGFYYIRDITTNPDWERAYQYEIPVLARIRFDGT